MRLARRAVAAVLQLSELRLLALDEALARKAADLASQLRVRGADAVYIAAAVVLRVPLATWDLEQRERAARIIDVVVPDAP